jgi:hypothetical protein
LEDNGMLMLDMVLLCLKEKLVEKWALLAARAAVSSSSSSSSVARFLPRMDHFRNI